MQEASRYRISHGSGFPAGSAPVAASRQAPPHSPLDTVDSRHETFIIMANALSEKAIVEIGRRTMRNESEMITAAADRLDETFARVVQLLVKCRGKVVVCGIGKSGHVGRKMVASLCSTGTPAVFLHPSEAVHGDLGLYQPGDPSILISKSGATHELLDIFPILRQMQSPIVVITGNLDSELARQADFVLDATVSSEADPDGFVPTASSTVTLAIGDALAVASMQARGFTPEDFARFHPSGQLGRNLTRRVEDVLHPSVQVACVHIDDTLKTVVIAMTERNLGAACVVSVEDRHALLGIVTDGDVRRALQAHDDVFRLTASDIMTGSPTTVSPDAPLAEAVRLMEDRPRQIGVLPVVDTDGRFCGLLRLHDIYQR